MWWSLLTINSANGLKLTSFSSSYLTCSSPYSWITRNFRLLSIFPGSRKCLVFSFDPFTFFVAIRPSPFPNFAVRSTTCWPWKHRTGAKVLERGIESVRSGTCVHVTVIASFSYRVLSCFGFSVPSHRFIIWMYFRPKIDCSIFFHSSFL